MQQAVDGRKLRLAPDPDFGGWDNLGTVEDSEDEEQEERSIMSVNPDTELYHLHVPACPYVQDPRDVTAGHAVIDSQGASLTPHLRLAVRRCCCAHLCHGLACLLPCQQWLA